MFNFISGFVYAEHGVKRVTKEFYTGRPDNYKMSEDTLLHRKLSKYFKLFSIKLYLFY